MYNDRFQVSETWEENKGEQCNEQESGAIASKYPLSFLALIETHLYIPKLYQEEICSDILKEVGW
jgi:hypothetical protein